MRFNFTTNCDPIAPSGRSRTEKSEFLILILIVWQEINRSVSFQLVKESEITIEEAVKEVDSAVTAVCNELKVPLEPACSAVDSGADVATEEPIVRKQPAVSLPNELDDEHELNGCQLWGNNWRQLTSVLPGMLLLFTIGLHNVFAVYELDYFTTDTPGNLKNTFADHSAFDPVESFAHGNDLYGSGPRRRMKHPKSTTIVMMWYLGAVLGSLFGAVLVRNMKKRSIYVSCRCVHFSVVAFIAFSLFSLHSPFSRFPVFGSISANHCRSLLFRHGKLLHGLQIDRHARLHRSDIAICLGDSGKTHFGNSFRHCASDCDRSRIRNWVETNAPSDLVRDHHNHRAVRRILFVLDEFLVQ